eukprot:TRINITY_DN4281_c0_g1_i2.p1 TRINITY_DN4281_c0_g1~~TRINITY_DN4281_c0_g1_i2.p1  ORF type:complete len:412 (+),score=100.52 TRINITY_DN4281_c0_g1_i2:62-1297(+)
MCIRDRDSTKIDWTKEIGDTVVSQNTNERGVFISNAALEEAKRNEKARKLQRRLFSVQDDDKGNELVTVLKPLELKTFSFDLSTSDGRLDGIGKYPEDEGKRQQEDYANQQLYADSHLPQVNEQETLYSRGYEEEKQETPYSSSYEEEQKPRRYTKELFAEENQESGDGESGEDKGKYYYETINPDGSGDGDETEEYEYKDDSYGDEEEKPDKDEEFTSSSENGNVVDYNAEVDPEGTLSEKEKERRIQENNLELKRIVDLGQEAPPDYYGINDKSESEQSPPSRPTENNREPKRPLEGSLLAKLRSMEDKAADRGVWKKKTREQMEQIELLKLTKVFEPLLVRGSTEPKPDRSPIIQPRQDPKIDDTFPISLPLICLAILLLLCFVILFVKKCTTAAPPATTVIKGEKNV